MAQSKLKITLTWENTQSFECKAKKNDENELSILSMDEDGNIGDLWPHAQAALQKYFTTQLEAIGAAMRE